LGDLKTNTTYVVEVVTTGTTTTLYVYEKDRGRSPAFPDSAFKSTLSVSGWSTARSYIGTIGKSTQTPNTIFVANLTEAVGTGALVGQGLVASDSITDPVTYDQVTQYFYDSQNRLVGTLLPNKTLNTTEYDAAGNIIRQTTGAVADQAQWDQDF